MLEVEHDDQDDESQHDANNINNDNESNNNNNEEDVNSQASDESINNIIGEDLMDDNHNNNNNRRNFNFNNTARETYGRTYIRYNAKNYNNNLKEMPMTIASKSRLLNNIEVRINNFHYSMPGHLLFQRDNANYNPSISAVYYCLSRFVNFNIIYRHPTVHMLVYTYKKTIKVVHNKINNINITNCIAYSEHITTSRLIFPNKVVVCEELCKYLNKNHYTYLLSKETTNPHRLYQSIRKFEEDLAMRYIQQNYPNSVRVGYGENIPRTQDVGGIYYNRAIDEYDQIRIEKYRLASYLPNRLMRNEFFRYNTIIGQDFVLTSTDSIYYNPLLYRMMAMHENYNNLMLGVDNFNIYTLHPGIYTDKIVEVEVFYANVEFYLEPHDNAMYKILNKVEPPNNYVSIYKESMQLAFTNADLVLGQGPADRQALVRKLIFPCVKVTVIGNNKPYIHPFPMIGKYVLSIEVFNTIRNEESDVHGVKTYLHNVIPITYYNYYITMITKLSVSGNECSLYYNNDIELIKYPEVVCLNPNNGVGIVQQSLNSIQTDTNNIDKKIVDKRIVKMSYPEKNFRKIFKNFLFNKASSINNFSLDNVIIDDTGYCIVNHRMAKIKNIDDVTKRKNYLIVNQDIEYQIEINHFIEICCCFRRLEIDDVQIKNAANIIMQNSRNDHWDPPVNPILANEYAIMGAKINLYLNSEIRLNYEMYLEQKEDLDKKIAKQRLINKCENFLNDVNYYKDLIFQNKEVKKACIFIDDKIDSYIKSNMNSLDLFIMYIVLLIFNIMVYFHNHIYTPLYSACDFMPVLGFIIQFFLGIIMKINYYFIKKMKKLQYIEGGKFRVLTKYFVKIKKKSNLPKLYEEWNTAYNKLLDQNRRKSARVLNKYINIIFYIVLFSMIVSLTYCDRVNDVEFKYISMYYLDLSNGFIHFRFIHYITKFKDIFSYLLEYLLCMTNYIKIDTNSFFRYYYNDNKDDLGDINNDSFKHDERNNTIHIDLNPNSNLYQILFKLFIIAIIIIVFSIIIYMIIRLYSVFNNLERKIIESIPIFGSLYKYCNACTVFGFITESYYDVKNNLLKYKKRRDAKANYYRSVGQSYRLMIDDFMFGFSYGLIIIYIIIIISFYYAITQFLQVIDVYHFSDMKKQLIINEMLEYMVLFINKMSQIGIILRFTPIKFNYPVYISYLGLIIYIYRFYRHYEIMDGIVSNSSNDIRNLGNYNLFVLFIFLRNCPIMLILMILPLVGCNSFYQTGGCTFNNIKDMWTFVSTVYLYHKFKNAKCLEKHKDVKKVVEDYYGKHNVNKYIVKNIPKDSNIKCNFDPDKDTEPLTNIGPQILGEVHTYNIPFKQHQCKRNQCEAVYRQISCRCSYDDKIMNEFINYSRRWIKRMVDDYYHYNKDIITLREYFQKLGPKAGEYKRAYLEYLEGKAVQKEYRMHNKADEKLPIDPIAMKNKARNISAQRSTAKVTMGMTCEYGMKVLHAQDWCGPGTNFDQKAEKFSDWNSRLGSNGFLCCDGSSFDSTQHQIMIEKIDGYFLELVLKYNRDSLMRYFSYKDLQQVIQQTKFDIYTKYFYFTVMGTQLSGRMNTCLCNTLRSACYVRFTAYKAGLKIGEVMFFEVTGDDQVIMIMTIYKDRYVTAAYKYVYLKSDDAIKHGLGQICKIFDWYPNKTGAEYLSCIILFSEETNEFLFTRKIDRFLCLTPFTIRNTYRNPNKFKILQAKLAKEIGYSLKLSCKDIDIFRVYAEKLFNLSLAQLSKISINIHKKSALDIKKKIDRVHKLLGYKIYNTRKLTANFNDIYKEYLLSKYKITDEDINDYIIKIKKCKSLDDHITTTLVDKIYNITTIKPTEYLNRMIKIWSSTHVCERLIRRKNYSYNYYKRDKYELLF